MQLLDFAGFRLRMANCHSKLLAALDGYFHALEDCHGDTERAAQLFQVRTGQQVVRWLLLHVGRQLKRAACQPGARLVMCQRRRKQPRLSHFVLPPGVQTLRRVGSEQVPELHFNHDLTCRPAWLPPFPGPPRYMALHWWDASATQPCHGELHCVCMGTPGPSLRSLRSVAALQ